MGGRLKVVIVKAGDGRKTHEWGGVGGGGLMGGRGEKSIKRIDLETERWRSGLRLGQQPDSHRRLRAPATSAAPPPPRWGHSGRDAGPRCDPDIRSGSA